MEDMNEYKKYMEGMSARVKDMIQFKTENITETFRAKEGLIEKMLGKDVE